MTEAAAEALRLATASLTEVGCVRDHNEDACGEFEDASGRRLLVVADGMGGHRGGATASRVTVDTIGEVFRSRSAEPHTLLHEAVEAANARVHGRSQEDPELRGMGTTAVCLLFSDGAAWVAHVGDSRAYRLRRGRMEALTSDHSVVGEMQRQGLLSEEDAASHPRRNEILRSVGVEPRVKPDVTHVDVEEGDRFLLCSDGLSGLVRADEMAAVLQRQPPDQAVRTLVQTALQRGAPDNVTVQVAAVPGGESTEAGLRREAPAEAIERHLALDARERRIRRVAAVTALVAGLLAAALLWLVFGAGLDAPAGSPPAGEARAGDG